MFSLVTAIFNKLGVFPSISFSMSTGWGRDLAGGETRGCVTWRSDGKVKVGDRYNVGEGGDVVVVDIASFLADYAD